MGLEAKEALNKSHPVIPGLLKAEPGIQAFGGFPLSRE